VEKFFLGLLVFVPLSLFARVLGITPVWVFFLSAIAIVPLAKFIGESTEELASHTNPALGGLLNATFGNATELIIGIFALNAGLIEVVKASITGSIIGNLLFVLGISMFVGGLNREKQTFNRMGIMASGSTLFVAVVALVIPALFVQTDGSSLQSSVEQLSIIVSIALLVVYFAGLIFSLHTHKHLYIEEVGKYEPRWSISRSVATLFVSMVAVAWMSNILVNSIQPLIQTLGWTQLFVGVICIAIVGNAAEHFSAATVARKNRMDLSLQISIGSAAQIAMLVAPLLVLVSFLIGHPMSLIFDTLEVLAIALSVVAVNLIIADGESNWFEGLQLLMAYAIVAVAFFFHP
jgi:Ca2+:H+ antiporter